jgi:glycosyltransferase involved in cell wall biosynthesis
VRILQVATYISPDGAYGGPTRVAINQAKALTELGHEVILTASAGGFEGKLPTTYDDFPVKLFTGRQAVPRAGFAGLTAPQLFPWLSRALKGADIVHVHMSRDLVTLPSAAMALKSKIPLVVQTHGMIDSSEKFLAKPLDAILTAPILRGASKILYLTEKEKFDISEVAQYRVAVDGLPNGVTVPDIPAVEQLMGAAENPEIICLARVHAIKRPLAFIQAGAAITSKWTKSRFTLIGPDEGEGQKVNNAIRQIRPGSQVSWLGPIPPEQTTNRMQQSSIFVLPSESELYSMSTLEAMSLGLPVVITDTSGLAPLVRENHAGLVCDKSQSSLNDAIDELLQNPAKRIAMGKNARNTIQEKFAMGKVALKLDAQYRNVIARAR